MRAAIDDLQGALRDVRVQLAPCAAISTAAAPPPAADPHAGHTMPMVAPSKELKQPKVIDPVTGLMVDPTTAPKTTYQRQTYYFSSEEARREFLRDPVKFVKKPKQ
jgi:YHS domain-containing protein